MTTCTQDAQYTAEDVERDAKLVGRTLAMARLARGAEEPLERLKAAALEGAKVPGLVEQVRLQTLATSTAMDAAAQVPTLQARVDELERHMDSGLGAIKERLLDAFPESEVAAIGERFRDRDPVWNMDSVRALAEYVASLAAQVPGLQAQVAQLTAERDERAGQHKRQMEGARQAVDAVRKLQARAESERDAAKARVKDLEDEREVSARKGAKYARDLEARIAGLEQKVQKEASLREAWAANVREVELALGFDRPNGMTMQDARGLVSERDALRAQVAEVPALVRKALHRHGLSSSLCNESAEEVRRALSAPATETPPAPEGTSARPYRMLSALDVRPTVPPVLPLSERVRQSLVKLGHEPTPLTTTAADALRPSGRCTCAGEGTCAWCRARCDACCSPYIPEAVRHALSQVWSALHVTTAHQGVAVAVLRAVYPELPVPDGDEGTESVKLLRSRMAATVEGALGMRKPPEALSYQDVVMMAQACKAALSDMLDRHDLPEPARDRIALVHNSLVDVWQGVAFLQHLAGSAMVRAVRDAARLGAEDMRERASKAVVSANAPRRGTFDIARAVRDLPLPGEEAPRG